MEVGKVSFSDKGFKDFEGLTRQEQKVFLKKRMPLQINFDKELKNIQYAKRKGVEKKAKQSKQFKPFTKGSGEDSFNRHKDKESKEG